ncbi:hypothetical protein L596_026775 [Steinernema carpocapsae]|uniref:SRR1-like domain-containing protein n=1 Tax=Steinernema carpocapsae TaxID=34508 RepID=A0A4U5M2C5_STECR|nr:hypothetical protein L596_026775 [Steinernema carpocapsae]
MSSHAIEPNRYDDVRESIQASKTALLQRIKEVDETFKDVSSDTIIQIIMEKIKNCLNGRRIRNLRGVRSDLPKTIDRLGNLSIFLALKKRSSPMTCAFEDPLFSETEKEFLKSEGVSTLTPQDFLSEKIAPFEDENLVDVFFIPRCNLVLMNNLLFSNWNSQEMKQMLLICPEIEYGRGDRWRGLHALQGVISAYESKLVRSEQLYGDYHFHAVALLEFPCRLPEINRQEPHSKWCLAPKYLYRNPEGLVEGETHEILTSNLDLIRKHFNDTGFTQEYLANLEKALEGRRIRCLKFLGYKRLGALLHFLEQTAFVLNIKDHFGITKVIAQEPKATESDKAYLNSLGIATPEADECDKPEEGLEEDEVTLIYMRQLYTDLRNSLIKANRQQMRKLVVITDVYIGKGTDWYQNLNDEGKELLDKRSEDVKKMRLEDPEAFQLDELCKFEGGSVKFPLRYEIFGLTPPGEPFPWCPFFGMEILSYPKASL